MTDLQQFHLTANALLESLGLPAETFAHDQDAVSIQVEDRFAIRFSKEAADAYLFQGDWLNDARPSGLHGDWLMANQICPGALQPVMALNENGDLTCWMRLSSYAADTGELVEAFNMLVDRMDQLTPAVDV